MCPSEPVTFQGVEIEWDQPKPDFIVVGKRAFRIYQQELRRAEKIIRLKRELRLLRKRVLAR